MTVATDKILLPDEDIRDWSDNRIIAAYFSLVEIGCWCKGDREDAQHLIKNKVVPAMLERGI